MGCCIGKPFSATERAAVIERKTAGAGYAEIAEQLGRPKGSIETVWHRHLSLGKRGEKTITQRPCMCCAKTFSSEGPHNRLCGNCRSKDQDSYSLRL